MKAIFNENEFDIEMQSKQNKEHFLKNILNFISNIFTKIIAIKDNEIFKMFIYMYKRIAILIFTIILILILGLIYVDKTNTKSNTHSNKILTNKEIKLKIKNYAMILKLKNKISAEKTSLFKEQSELKILELKKYFN